MLTVEPVIPIELCSAKVKRGFKDCLVSNRHGAPLP